MKGGGCGEAEGGVGRRECWEPKGLAIVTYTLHKKELEEVLEGGQVDGKCMHLYGRMNRQFLEV